MHCLGCHILALDLVRSWSFARPAGTTSTMLFPPSPTSAPTFALPFALAAGARRESKILIDMDMLVEPPTRRASPELKLPDEYEPDTGAQETELAGLPSPRPKGESGLSELEHLRDEGDLLSRKAGLGSLMKSAKQNVQVPEFDMDNFGF